MYPTFAESPWSQFAASGTIIIPDETKIKINESVVLFENQAMTFELYRSLNSVDDSEMQEVQEYAELVGSTLSKKILLYRG